MESNTNSENFEYSKNSENSENEEENMKKFRIYLQFWIGQLFSLLGSAVVSFVVIWQLSEMDPGNNTIISVAYFANFLPQIIISPIAGVIADKWDKKKIIIISDTTQALLTMVLILLFFLKIIQIWHIVLLIFLRGVCQAFQSPVAFAIVPILVPKDKMTRINGLNFLLSGVINIIAPLIGAWLLVFLTIEKVLWVDIITFAIAFFTIIRIKISSNHEKEPQSDGTIHSNKIVFLKEIKTGLKIVKEIKGLGSVMLMAVFLNFIFMPIDALMVNFIKIVHDGTKVELGYFMAAFQVGMLFGALLTTVVKKWKNWYAWILFGLISEGVAYLILGLIPKGMFLLLYLDAVLMIFMNPIVNSLFQTGIQSIVPKDKLGRIVSIIMVMTNIASPLGLLLAGILADTIGSIQVIYVGCGILTLIVIGITSFSRGFRDLTLHCEQIVSNVSSPQISEIPEISEKT